MIDIHSHILPGLDDGSPAFDISLDMARMAHDAGTTDIVATPHANTSFCHEPVLIAERIAELQNAGGPESGSTGVAISIFHLETFKPPYRTRPGLR